MIYQIWKIKEDWFNGCLMKTQTLMILKDLIYQEEDM